MITPAQADAAWRARRVRDFDAKCLTLEHLVDKKIRECYVTGQPLKITIPKNLNLDGPGVFEYLIDKYRQAGWAIRQAEARVLVLEVPGE